MDYVRLGAGLGYARVGAMLRCVRAHVMLGAGSD